jgi:hypothetical protein
VPLTAASPNKIISFNLPNLNFFYFKHELLTPCSIDMRTLPVPAAVLRRSVYTLDCAGGGRITDLAGFTNEDTGRRLSPWAGMGRCADPGRWAVCGIAVGNRPSSTEKTMAKATRLPG